jgi:hypothetical protein
MNLLIAIHGMAASPVSPKTKRWRIVKVELMLSAIANSTWCYSSELSQFLTDKHESRIAQIDFYRGLHLLKDSEACDKAYSCLWFFDELGGENGKFPLFQVDYSKTLSVIYTEFTVALIKIKNIDIPLHYACQRGKKDEFPSWVPDWSQTDGFQELDDFYTSFGAKDYILPESPNHIASDYQFQNGSMFVLAHAVGTISACVAVSGSEEVPVETDEWKALYQTTSSLLSILAEYANGGLRSLPGLFGPDFGERPWTPVTDKKEQSIADDLGVDLIVLRLQVLRDLIACWHEFDSNRDIADLNFLCCSRTVHEILRPFYKEKEIEAFPRSIAYEKFGSEAALYLLGLACEKGINFLSIFNEVIMGRLAGRIMSCTSGGSVGFALAVEPGDEVAIWKGMSCPVVVRKMKDQETEQAYWKMVSIAYVDGMMEGEKYDEKKLAKFEVR